ncbi:MAG: hypothetical protein WBF93_04260 [Pirellulales bacterium]
MAVLFAVRYRCAYWLGGLLARARYTRTRRIEREGEIVYEKHRPWWRAPLIVAGNVYLWMSRSGTRVLEARGWEKRECAMHALLYHRDVQCDARGRIVIPALPGRPLAQVLASARTHTATKLEMVAAAVAALQEFHKLPVDAESPGTASHSHGDATIFNVLVDEQAKTACWIDFDMAHDERLPREWRRADDLRALIYSAAMYFERQELSRLVETVVQSLDDPATLRALREAIEFWRRRPNAFHLAQARLERSQREHLDTQLAQDLPGN